MKFRIYYRKGEVEEEEKDIECTKMEFVIVSCFSINLFGNLHILMKKTGMAASLATYKMRIGDTFEMKLK